MMILALEFSSEQRSVAVVRGGPQPQLLGRVSEVGGRNTRALQLVTQALAEAGVEREAVECIAVGVGPGSYAGIRAAIALAQGWQAGRAVKLLAIPSADCLAWQAQARGLLGYISIVIDAQRREFYFSRYHITDLDRRHLEPMRIVPKTALDEEILLVGPDADKIWPGALNLSPDAAALGILASQRSDFIQGEKLEPIYLREVTFVKAPPARVIE